MTAGAYRNSRCQLMRHRGVHRREKEMTAASREEKRPSLECQRSAELDDVAQEVLGNLPIAVAAESKRIIGVGDRDYRDDRFR